MEDNLLENNLCEIGSEVEIDLMKVNDRLPEYLIAQLKEDPSATVVDYRMTDATGIGYILEFKNKTTSWFFSSEIKGFYNKGIKLEEGNKNHFIDNLNKASNKLISKNVIKPSKDIKYLIIPNNFVKWLLFSIKDVV